MLETNDLAHEIRREHAQLLKALLEIEGELERLEPETGPSHHPGKLLGMLTMFRHHLFRHFELEEQGGFLIDRSEMNPGTRRTIQDLLPEHKAILTRLEGLIESLEQVDLGSAGLTDTFITELKALIADLHAHERTENELVQELAFRDIGGHN